MENSSFQIPFSTQAAARKGPHFDSALNVAKGVNLHVADKALSTYQTPPQSVDCWR